MKGIFKGGLCVGVVKGEKNDQRLVDNRGSSRGHSIQHASQQNTFRRWTL